ncbi:MAG TPA: TspO/MBR family protein [Devosia sp.]|jgi:tryptophan-rich sensory protein|nr:TspO/MBR family protein [Devosia sp.]
MDTIALDYRNPRTIIVTLLFIGLVVGVGAVIGINTAPDGWYAALEKPPFNPPNWLFGPVWFTLYVLIGIAGARTFLRDPTSPAMFIWGAQMVLNWAWSPTWFTLHLLWPAFAIIVAILALIVAFIVATWKSERLSALLFVPYAAWVAFAGTLNLSIALLN